MKEDAVIYDGHAGLYSRRQQLFFRYSFLVLIDLTVLNLLDEYWEHVSIELFSVSLLAAILLQFLLQVTVYIEHKAASYFKDKSGLKAKVQRGLSTWGILFISKLIILEAINIAFGDGVLFGGPLHGLVAFIAVVITIITAEQVFFRIYRALN